MQKKHTFFTKSNMVGLFGKANLKLDMIQVGQCLFQYGMKSWVGIFKGCLFLGCQEISYKKILAASLCEGRSGC